MSNLKPFIISCDTGRDDALAMWLILSLGLPLKAVIASYGNTTRDNALHNTAGVLNVAKRSDIPLFAGANLPSHFHPGYQEILRRWAIGGNGVCGVDLPPDRSLPEPSSPEELAEIVKRLFEENGPLDYIALDPATNIASIVKALGGEASRYFNTIYMSGSKFEEMWQHVPGADFNVLADPFAVQALLESGLDVRFIPMDVLFPVFSTLEDIEKYNSVSEVARYAKEIMAAHCQKYTKDNIFRHIDPAAIMAILNPDAFKQKKLSINFNGRSANFARLIEDAEGCPVRVYESNPEQAGLFKAVIIRHLGLN